jgi:hypothetical protein
MGKPWPTGGCCEKKPAVLLALPAMARRRQALLQFINNCLVVYVSMIDSDILFRRIYKDGQNLRSCNV